MRAVLAEVIEDLGDQGDDGCLGVEFRVEEGDLLVGAVTHAHACQTLGQLVELGDVDGADASTDADVGGLCFEVTA